MLKFIFEPKNRFFKRMWSAQLISQFGDRIHQMALIGLIAERAPGSAVQLAKLISFTIIPVFVVGPIAGVFVDRWDRRKILLVCDLLRACMVILIPFIFIRWHSMIPIYILVFLIFCCSRFYIPAKMAIIPDLVTKDNLLVANSLMTTTGMIAFVMGCALGGFLVEIMGARGGFIIDAVTFLVSGLLIASISKDFHLHLHRKEILDTGREFLKVEKSVWKEIKEGVLYLKGMKEIRFVITMMFVLMAAAGAIYVVIIVFVQEAFHSMSKLGILAVFLGLGLFIGALAYGRWGRKYLWYRVIFFCLIFGGMMIVAFAVIVKFHPVFIGACCLGFLLGLIIGPVFIAANTITHMVADKKMRGKVFTALEIVIHFAFLVSMLISSFLSEYIGRCWILMGVGLIFSFIGVIGTIKYRKGDLKVIQ